jgi:hypothetical protein
MISSEFTHSNKDPFPLNEDIFLLILKKIDLPTLLNSIPRTNSTFYSMAKTTFNEESLWRDQYHKNGFFGHKDQNWNINCLNALKEFYQKQKALSKEDSPEMIKNIIVMALYIATKDIGSLLVFFQSQPEVCLQILLDRNKKVASVDHKIYKSLIQFANHQNNQALLECIYQFIKKHNNKDDTYILFEFAIFCRQKENVFKELFTTNRDIFDFESLEQEYKLLVYTVKYNNPEAFKFLFQFLSRVKNYFSKDVFSWNPYLKSEYYPDFEGPKYLYFECFLAAIKRGAEKFLP